MYGIFTYTFTIKINHSCRYGRWVRIIASCSKGRPMRCSGGEKTSFSSGSFQQQMVWRIFPQCQGEKNSRIMIDNSKLRKWTCFFEFLLIFLGHFWEITFFSKIQQQKYQNKSAAATIDHGPVLVVELHEKTNLWWKGSILVFLPCDMLA